ncbi:hypothetical protein WH47_11748 [Habropoda laboriosa]|uniref:Uncharacterized protein n=1 Tax=Habropoda laboriosa TaxID=597456 RepID=A0A0L7R890_9HYME|nr:hypothetical protein WH47_11748 [Habropoda laboriosa]
MRIQATRFGEPRSRIILPFLLLSTREWKSHAIAEEINFIEDEGPLQDDSSLGEDFQDILVFVPTTEVRQIIERYVKYDAQIGDTVCFVNDQKRYDLEIADGGLMDTILRTIPLDELHELLRQKVKYSSRFRMFLYASRSKDYREMCIALEETKVLYHHSFWAKESGLEITFAIELYNEIYVYLTQTLVS